MAVGAVGAGAVHGRGQLGGIRCAAAAGLLCPGVAGRAAELRAGAGAADRSGGGGRGGRRAVVVRTGRGANVFAVYEGFENAYLVPKVMRNAVDLPGLAIILALAVGAALGGVLGAVLAVPTAALVAELLGEYARQPEEE